MAFNLVGVESLAARERLIDMSGGLDSFARNTAGFAQNFLSEDERRAPVLAAVRKELDAMGLQAIDTRDEFKEYVLSLDLLDAAEAERFGKLIQMQDQFAVAYPVTDKATESLDLLNSQREMEAQI
ncbi:hypothetical protein WCE10_21855, partial [Cronobacter muytjensii]|uniref:hypothetical protein n=1 Tax=Cronobacter muytjensii TaxID=413501 RepID=UPI0034D49ED5